MKFLSSSFLQPFFYFFPVGSKYSPQHPGTSISVLANIILAQFILVEVVVLIP
jgi:hypothetical protein